MTRGRGTLWLWNWYLWAHQLPEVNTVGTGLPDALRHRGGARQAVIVAARALGRDITVGIPTVAQAANRQRLPTSSFYITTAAGTTGRHIVGLAGVGSSTAALKAAPSGSAAAGPSSTRAARTFEADSRDSDATASSASTLAALIGNTETQLTRQVEDALIVATIDHDELLQLALRHSRDDLRRNAENSESHRATITRLAVRFLRSRASARDAILELARANWDLDGALAAWYDGNSDDGKDGDGADNQDDEEGQPPRKKRRFDDRSEGEGDEKGKGKGKGKEKAN